MYRLTRLINKQGSFLNKTRKKFEQCSYIVNAKTVAEETYHRKLVL